MSLHSVVKSTCTFFPKRYISFLLKSAILFCHKCPIASLHINLSYFEIMLTYFLYFTDFEMFRWCWCLLPFYLRTDTPWLCCQSLESNHYTHFPRCISHVHAIHLLCYDFNGNLINSRWRPLDLSVSFYLPTLLILWR